MHPFEKLHKLNEALTDFYVEREDVCQTAILALVSRQHHLQIGPPGTAKSAIVYSITRAITGASIFDILMTRTMNPDELFGPVSLKGMEEDDFRRCPEGFLPEANIAFFDEAEKTSDAVRFSLLQVMNERKVRNGKHHIHIPIISAFLGMNKLFEEFEEDPIYSRVLFRHYVNYVQEKYNFDKMLTESCLNNNTGPHTENIGLTKQDLVVAHEIAMQVNVDRVAMDCMWEIRSSLKEEGFTVDDRKCVWLVRAAVRAQAALSGRDIVESEDFEILQHCLWNDPNDMAKIRSIVLKIANPTGEEANQYIDSAHQCYNKAMKFKKDNPEDTKEVQMQWLSANREVVLMGNRLKDRVKETSGKSRKMLEDGLLKVGNMNEKILAELKATKIQ